jgi:hypothetical protein
MSEHTGLLGALSEAGEIREKTGCTVAESFEIQSHLADLREQEYRDAIAEIDERPQPTTIGNVTYVDFCRR